MTTDSDGKYPEREEWMDDDAPTDDVPDREYGEPDGLEPTDEPDEPDTLEKSVTAGNATPAQLEAGNYRKPKVAFQGLLISIENPAGSVRSGADRDGHKWRVKMRNAYGYIRGSLGVDGDHVDCYLGPDKEAATAYIVHQRKAGRWDEYDEDKVMLGFQTEAAARTAYLKHYDDPRFLGPITAMPMDEFKAKVLASRKHPRMIKAIRRDARPAARPDDPNPAYREVIRKKLADMAVMQRKIAEADRNINQAARERLLVVQREIDDVSHKDYGDDNAGTKYRDLLLERARLHRLLS